MSKHSRENKNAGEDTQTKDKFLARKKKGPCYNFAPAGCPLWSLTEIEIGFMEGRKDCEKKE